MLVVVELLREELLFYTARNYRETLQKFANGSTI